jgi:hypothetical protein
MTARTISDLEAQAASDACEFARSQPDESRVLLMDFGKADKYQGRYGAQLRLGAHFSNAQILDALKAAADTYSTPLCYRRGAVRLTYGNTNNMPITTMSEKEVREAGHHQAFISRRLRLYERRRGYLQERVAVAGDIEPQWNLPGITKVLVDAAAAGGIGGPYLNYGAASECPPESRRCSNHWDFGDLGQVSFGGVKRPLPEIYRPVHAIQWTRVRRRWDRRHGHGHCFYGTTATPGFPLSPTRGWRRLAGRNPCVTGELVEIREQPPKLKTETGSAARATLGTPMRATYSPQLLGPRRAQAGLTEPEELWPVRNAWLVSSHRELTAVYAGANPSDPSEGRLVVFRQDFVRVTQTADIVDVPDAGPLRITAAPLAPHAKRSLQRRGSLTFTGKRGPAGTLHLEDDSVALR